jgi:hypothetical protein
MSWLAENALPIWMCGAVALTMAIIVYVQTRENKALAGVVLVMTVTAALLVVEWLMETPREAVERTLYDLAAVVESNDVAATLTYLAPTAGAELRRDVETLMPLVTIERARILSTPKIELENAPEPASAVVECRGFILAVVKRDGMKGGKEDHLTMTWIRRGDRWLLESYTSKRNWHRALGH